MRRMWCALAAVGSVCAVVLSPPAWAAVWSPPVDVPMVLVPFGAQRPAGVHRGVDLQADPGSQVRSPAAGQVVFAGAVPADGGGTCVAVTIETQDGFRISLLPLDGAYVCSGARVTEGESLGRLAAAGDDSSHASHLHIGLREGDRYVDPAPFLPAMVSPPVSAPASADEPAVVGGSQEAGSPQSDAVVEASAAESPSAESAGSGQTGRVASSVPGDAAGVPGHDVGRTEVGANSPAVSPAPQSAGPVVRQARLLPQAGVSSAGPESGFAPGTRGGAGGGTWASGRSVLGPTAGAAGEALSRSLAPAAVLVAAVAGAVRVKALVRVR